MEGDRLIVKLYLDGDLVETWEVDHGSCKTAAQASSARTEEALAAGQMVRLEVFDPDGVIGPPDEPVFTDTIIPVGVGVPDPAMN